MIVAQVPIFSILNAFSRAEIFCTIGFGPDGDKDSTGAPYMLHLADTQDMFIVDLVEEAQEYHGGVSVAIELRALPDIDDDGHVVGNYTMREHPITIQR